MTKHFTKLTSLILGTTLAATVASAAGGELQKVMKARGLTENDIIVEEWQTKTSILGLLPKLKIEALLYQFK